MSRGTQQRQTKGCVATMKTFVPQIRLSPPTICILCYFNQVYITTFLCTLDIIECFVERVTASLTNYVHGTCSVAGLSCVLCVATSIESLRLHILCFRVLEKQGIVQVHITSLTFTYCMFLLPSTLYQLDCTPRVVVCTKCRQAIWAYIRFTKLLWAYICVLQDE